MKLKFSRYLIIFPIFGLMGLGLAMAMDPTASMETIPSMLGIPGVNLHSGFPERGKELYRLWENGQKKKAFNDVRSWMREEVRSPYPWVVASSFYVQEGRNKKALSMGKNALKKKPQCADAYYWRGRAYEALDRPLEAANEYRAALFAKKEFASAQEGLDRATAKLNGQLEPDAQVVERQTR